MPTETSPKNDNFFPRLVRAIFGAPKHLKDPHLFHKMALIPVLAWVGLGADGLSSSAYGPEEAFRALGEHTYLARLPRPGHGADRLHHLLRLFAHHRALSPRRRRLHRGHPHAGGEGRGRLGQRPAGGLRDDHHHLDRLLRGCRLQLRAGPEYPPLQGAVRLHPDRDPDRPQHPRRQGIDNGHGADLHDLRRHPYPDAGLRGFHPYRQDAPRW